MHLEKEFFEQARPSSSLKRFATVDEVAAMVTYVASELSSATSGAALRVDGGVVKSNSLSAIPHGAESADWKLRFSERT